MKNISNIDQLVLQRKYTIDLKIVEQIKRIIQTKQFRCTKIKGGYKILVKSKNKYLFNLLEKVKYFEFKSTNKGNITSLHEIIKYLYTGYKAYLNGFTIDKNIHVHHIDSNTSNNAPGNLVYVSSQEHLLITQACTMDTDHIKVFDGSVCPFNNKGESVSNMYHRLTHLVKITLTRTLKSFGINFKIQSHKIFKAIPNYLGFKRFNWCPSFVSSVISELQRKMWRDNTNGLLDSIL